MNGPPTGGHAALGGGVAPRRTARLQGLIVQPDVSVKRLRD